MMHRDACGNLTGQLPTACLWLLALTMSGCGPSTGPSPQTAPSGDAGPHPETAPIATAAPSTAAIPQETAGDQRWVGDIPYDVFFDQPLQIAAENSATGTLVRSPAPVVTNTDPASPPSTGGTDAPATGETTGGPAEAGVIAWQEIAPIGVLEEETKQLRNRLTSNLQTVATFNKNVESIANDGATLAALAAVIADHPDEIGWKDKAVYVRDLGHELFLKAEGSGRTPYNDARKPFERIITIFDGGPPPEQELPASVPLAEIADRGEMMKRIKKSFDFLKSEINTEARLTEEAAAAVREGTVLTVLGRLLQDHSYDSADEPQYQQFAQDFVEGCQGMVKSVGDQEYSAFQAAHNRVQNACNACHGDYAFGDEGL